MKRKTAQENVEYVLDDRFVLQEASGSDSTHPSYRRYYYGKEPLAVLDSGQSVRFLSVDALGSVSDFTTTSGTLYQSRQYDAWGQYRNGTAPAANQPKLGYTGHQFDPETGLVYARARYYDAETGVFLSRDAYEGELDDAPSLHRYAYAWGNPLRFWDRTGFCTEGDDAGCENTFGDRLVAIWDSLTSSETRDESLARQREERHQRTVATVNEDPSAPETKPEGPQDPDDANIAEVLRDSRYLAAGQQELAEKAKPVIQTTVELAAPTATAAATLETRKSFWGQDATPEEMSQARRTVVGSAAAPVAVGAVAKYGGKLWTWGRQKGGALLGKLFGRGEKAAEEAASVSRGSAIVNDILDKPRVGSALKDDAVKVEKLDGANYGRPMVREFPATAKGHGWPDIIDNYAGDAAKFDLGNGATLHQVEGSYNGVQGRFEWITQSGDVTHRQFVHGGSVTGTPIKR